MKVYRIENQTSLLGIWRDFEGNLSPIFDKLTDGKCKNLPMEDSDLYRKDGFKWFASAPTKETLTHWFSKKDALELLNMGYKIYEFEVLYAQKLNDFEYIFKREDIIEQKEIDYNVIYGENNE